MIGWTLGSRGHMLSAINQLTFSNIIYSIKITNLTETKQQQNNEIRDGIGTTINEDNPVGLATNVYLKGRQNML